MAKTLSSLPYLTLRDVLQRAFGGDDVTTRDSQAASIGVHVHTLYQWLSGKRLPSAELMPSLCARAKIELEEGLLLLNIWKSEGRVQAAYIRLLHRLERHYILRPTQDIVETGTVGPEVIETTQTSLEQIRM